MKEEIKKMLNNIVGEDLAKKIFEANFPEPIINYASGDILTFKEIKELPEGTVIYLHYVDEDGNTRTRDFHKLTKHSIDEYSTSDGFSFPIDEYNDDDLIEKCDNSGWTFTIRKAIKISPAEFKKIQKRQQRADRATELIQRLLDGEELSKEEKKELKKIGRFV
jgi:hypothetical protein